MRRKIGEDLLLECIQVVKFGGGSVMVWGCISCDGIGPITKVEGGRKNEWQRLFI